MNYFYRYDDARLASLASNGLSSLQQYMRDVSEFCHEDIFKNGPRSSSLHIDLNIPLELVNGHKMSKLATHALKNYLGTPHDKVQLCALENDPSMLAMEIPIWIKPADLEGVNISQKILDKIFKDGEVLTGHIDLISLEDGLIWIWDFKPNAHKERYASTQLFFYALMLAKRTRLNLNKFRCGYFDDKLAYLFKPRLKFLQI